MAAESKRKVPRKRVGPVGHSPDLRFAVVLDYAMGVALNEIEDVHNIPPKTTLQWAKATPGATEKRRAVEAMRRDERAHAGQMAVQAAGSAANTSRAIVRDFGFAALERAKALTPKVEAPQAAALGTAGAKAVALAEGWAARDLGAGMAEGALQASGVRRALIEMGRETGALERRLGELKATAPESAWAVRAVALADDALALVNGAAKRFDFEGEVSGE